MSAPVVSSARVSASLRRSDPPLVRAIIEGIMRHANGNRLVYDLYGLTEDEIRIVEGDDSP